MKNQEIIYQNGTITISRRQVFGKIGLAGSNKENGVTVTAFATNESQIENKINKMIYELNKDVARIDLTPRIEKIERAFVSSL